MNPDPEIVINKELQLAFDFVKYTNRNIFLTGKAGTGKTTFLHTLKKSSPKRMIVVAPTGVAAINAAGVTIHSFFQLPFHPFIPAIYLQENRLVSITEQKDGSGYRMSREKANIIRSLDLLVIDEISMVRADTLDAIDSALRRYKDRHLAFGGVQLLMIGDIQQLAPVVTEDEKELIGKYYDTPFFFGSRALRTTDYVTIELKHIFRQNDRAFIDLLNKVRDSHLDTEAFMELDKRFKPGFDPDSEDGYITLTTHNYQSQNLNDSHLEKLPGAIHSFKAAVNDEFPETSWPAPGELILKVGARVMFIKNDLSTDKLFFNGKMGIVESFDDNIIVVRCPGDDQPVRLEPAEWQNMKYTLNDETKEIEEAVIGTFTQYPLRLAWAVTIHKSQGLTFDKVVIDARDAFAHGQVYVALSRCRTLDGVVLSTKIGRQSIVEDHTISDFVSETERNQPGEKELADSRKVYQGLLLTELFDFTSLLRNLSYTLKIVNEHKESLQGNVSKTLEDVTSVVRSGMIEVSGRFNVQLTGLLKAEAEPESNPELQERVKKACGYFSGKLEEALNILPEDYSVETDNRAIRKSVSEALQRVWKEIRIKSACLAVASSGFTAAKYLEARAISSIDSGRIRYRKKKAEESTTDITKHPELARRLKEWRNLKAGELNVPHYVIMHQKTLYSLAEATPRTLRDLKKVKGIGRYKSERFGEELLKIIDSYCTEQNIEAVAESIT